MSKKNALTKSAKELPLSEVADALIGAAADSDVLGNVPVISIFTGLAKAYGRYKRERFRLKLQGFVTGAGGFTQADADKVESMASATDDPYFVEALLEIIERCESEQKAKIHGACFRRLIQGRVDRETFSHQVRVTDSMYIVDIFHFMHGYHNHNILENRLGDILVGNYLCKKETSLAKRVTNILRQESEQYVNVVYTVSGQGVEYLKTLHTAYRDKINPERLILD